MKETILLFNLADKQTRRKVELALFPLKLRLRYIPKDQYNQPLGALCRAWRRPTLRSML